jgi:hypothetical protein
MVFVHASACMHTMGSTGSAMSATRGFVSLELFPLANNKTNPISHFAICIPTNNHLLHQHSPPRPPLLDSTNTLLRPSFKFDKHSRRTSASSSSSLQPVHVWVPSAKCYIVALVASSNLVQASSKRRQASSKRRQASSKRRQASSKRRPSVVQGSY